MIFSAIFGVPLHICTREYVNAVTSYCSRENPFVREIHFVDIKADVVEAIGCQFKKVANEIRHKETDKNAELPATSATTLRMLTEPEVRS